MSLNRFPCKYIIVALLIIVPCFTAPAKTMAQGASPETPGDQQKDATDQTSPQQQEEAKIRAPTPNLEQEQQRLLRVELGTENIVTLSALDETFLALWTQDITGNPFGAALILHGAGETADWPSSVQSMRKELAKHGWNTLSVSLPGAAKVDIPDRPTPEPTPVPVAEEKDQNEAAAAAPPPTPAPSTETVAMKKKVVIDSETLVAARLKSALNYLNQQGQFNIVLIGNGLGAARAAQFIQTLSNSNSTPDIASNTSARRGQGTIQRPIRALVMVSARNAIPQSNTRLTDLLTDADLPLLDVVLNQHFLDSQEAKARKRRAGELRMKSYFQIYLTPPDSEIEDSDNRLVRRVRGFLNRYAKGVEIAN